MPRRMGLALGGGGGNAAVAIGVSKLFLNAGTYYTSVKFGGGFPCRARFT